MVEALSDQLWRDAVIRERDAERTRWERAVPLCDGSQDGRLRELMSEVDSVPAELKREVADRTARGPLAASIREYLERHPGGGWVALRETREYFSQEYAVSMRDELQRVERKPHEQLPNFLCRFRRLAGLAYPPRARSPEAEEIIVRSLARALKEERLVNQMTKGGFPTVDQAIERLTRVEADEAARERLTGVRREESGSGADVLAGLAQALGRVMPKSAPQPPATEQKAATEMEKLCIRLRQVEEKLTKAEKASTTAVSAKPTARDGQKTSEVRCFRCGGPHLRRD